MKKLSLFLACSLMLTVAFSQKRPNMVFILADDLGYGDVGCYGQQKINTPNIDALAKQGVRFTDFYSSSAVCAPARASFLTGVHQGHASVRGNVRRLPEGQYPMPDSIVTFPMILRRNGYSTGAFGKWSLGFISTSGDPLKKGFNEFYGYNDQTLAHNYYPDHLWHNHQRVDLPGNLHADSVYSADLIHQQALNFIKEKHDQPFFLYLPYTLPHADVVVPHDEVYDYYVKKFNEQPAEAKKTDDENHDFDPYPHAAYAAMVARLDRFVGEIMKTLKEKGLLDNTLVIFSSDNGPHKENGGDPSFFNSSGGLRGIKRDMYEGGIRVPFIAYMKGMTKAGTVNHAPFVMYDLFPTFLQLAGVKYDGKIDGISMVSALSGKAPLQHRYMYWELHEAGGRQAVRMGDWKAVRLKVTNNPNSPIELYNLKTDPSEKKNIASLFPAIVKQMSRIMQEAYVPNKDWPLFGDK